MPRTISSAPLLPLHKYPLKLQRKQPHARVAVCIPFFPDLDNISFSNMKNQPSIFLKQMFSFIVATAKAKSTALKTQLNIISLLRKKKLLIVAISNKIHSVTVKEKGGHGTDKDEDCSEWALMYNTLKNKVSLGYAITKATEWGEEGDNYPDFTHSLFQDEDDGLGDGTGSVIDLVKNAKEDASDFSLEDEINHVADVFIKRFHKKMKLQKLESFKRHQEMLASSYQKEG